MSEEEVQALVARETRRYLAVVSRTLDEAAKKHPDDRVAISLFHVSSALNSIVWEEM